MRKIRIVADSSVNLMTMETAALDAAHLKRITADRGCLLVGYEKF